jgi:uncharacterized membrane protein YraQ (UPF0718 family)
MGESLSVFSAIVAAIFLEAMPFLAFGALLSAAIEVFIAPDRIVRYVPKGRSAGIALGIVAGMVLPTCECGVVPVVRRLMRKGVPAHVAVAYMLAAPIVNPVVLASTWVAFRGSAALVGGRVLVAAAVAAVVGRIAGRMGGVLATRPEGEGEGHHSEHAAHGNRLIRVFGHAAREFLEMGRFLILGAVAAGLFKTFLPQEVLLFFVENLVLQILGMMLLAFLLSVCSEADAFVAASFQVFAPASQLAFVTLGPMLDLKLIGMYMVTFRQAFFWVLVLVPIVLVFAACLAFGLLL